MYHVCRRILWLQCARNCRDKQSYPAIQVPPGSAVCALSAGQPISDHPGILLWGPDVCLPKRGDGKMEGLSVDGFRDGPAAFYYLFDFFHAFTPAGFAGFYDVPCAS